MKIYFETLGCPKNFNDSQNAEGILEWNGHTIVDAPEEAEAIVVNTCGFINDAKVESIDMIFEMAELKKASQDDKILVVSGCLSQRYSDELYKEIPEVDIFIGVNEYEELPEILTKYKNERIRQVSAYDKGFLENVHRRIDSVYSTTIKIAEGCDNRCTYCVIPSIRGNYRSRKMEQIVSEAEELASKGCRELILIAQDVTNYGVDIYGEFKLPELLRRLCRIDPLQWIRVMYCYEDRITEELIEVMATEEKICKYIDIPLQHCSDTVLRNMHRRSTKESILKTIGKLRDAMPDIHIRTTLITGFPGESEADFEELLRFVENVRFERLGVFAYSQEEGTPAGEMENQIPEEIKTERQDAVMRRQLEISLETNKAKIGSTVQVMVDDIDEEGSYIGRTQYDAPEIDNSVIFTSRDPLRPGDIVDVIVEDAFDYDLTGRKI